MKVAVDTLSVTEEMRGANAWRYDIINTIILSHPHSETTELLKDNARAHNIHFIPSPNFCFVFSQIDFLPV